MVKILLVASHGEVAVKQNVDAVAVTKISELLGAGEIMLNCDFDGQGKV